MTDERDGEVRRALADPNRCDHDIFPCGLPRGHEGMHRTIVSVRGEVRVFRYTKPNGPVYRAFPDGRVTRNGEDVDPSNLEHCEAAVRQGAMTENSELLPKPVIEDPRISEIRAVLTEYASTSDLDALWGVRCRIRAIVDREPKRPEEFTLADLTGTAEDRVESVLEAFGVTVPDMQRFVTALVRCVPDQEPPPAPRVFFPGDTVPAGREVANQTGDVYRWDRDREVLPYEGPLIEVRKLSAEEWQAAVGRARAEREVQP